MFVDYILIDHSRLCPALLFVSFFLNGAPELVHFIGEKHQFQTGIKTIARQRDADRLLGDDRDL